MIGRTRKRMLMLSVLAMLMLVAATACVPEVLGLYVTMVKPGTTEDGLDYDTNDILFVFPWEAVPQWYKVFDGDELGLQPKHNITAFSFNELILHDTVDGMSDGVSANIEGPVQLYLSFNQTRIPVPGAGLVFGQDIVKFDGYFHDDHWDDYEYSLLFDGSDVGLTTLGEKVDGISVWPPEYYDAFADEIDDLPYDCNAGVIFITTQGRYRVPDNQGGFLIGDGSDVLLFCAVNLGDETAGFWFRAFDGSDAEFDPPNAGYGVDVWGISFHPAPFEDSGDLLLNILYWFTPKKPFDSVGVTGGQPSQLFIGGVIGEDPGFTEGDGAAGPFLDFNEGISITGAEFPGVNGVVDTAGVWDFPFTP